MGQKKERERDIVASSRVLKPAERKTNKYSSTSDFEQKMQRLREKEAAIRAAIYILSKAEDAAKTFINNCDVLKAEKERTIAISPISFEEQKSKRIITFYKPNFAQKGRENTRCAILCMLVAGQRQTKNKRLIRRF